TNSGTLMACSTGGYADVWFTYTPGCTGTVTVSTGCGGFNTLLSAYPSCGGASLACNDDTTGCGGGGSPITLSGPAGTTYLLQVALTYSGAFGSFSVNVSQGGAFTLAFSEPGGPGSGTIQIDFTNGPPGGLYFLAGTLNQGLFPSGWFFGVDIPFGELA